MLNYNHYNVPKRFLFLFRALLKSMPSKINIGTILKSVSRTVPSVKFWRFVNILILKWQINGNNKRKFEFITHVLNSIQQQKKKEYKNTLFINLSIFYDIQTSYCYTCILNSLLQSDPEKKMSKEIANNRYFFMPWCGTWHSYCCKQKKKTSHLKFS